MLDFAPDGLFDIHNHILPAIDDGASNMDEAFKMLDELNQLGYSQIAVSPHFDSSKFTPNIETQNLIIHQLDSKRTRIPPAISPGAEITFDDLFTNNDPSVFPTIAGQGEAHLLEFGLMPGSIPLAAEENIFGLKVKGFTCVLAHPERIPDLQRDPSRLESLIQAGALIQMNLMSLVGRYGRTARKLAIKILEKNQAHFAATDMHSINDIKGIKQGIDELAYMNRDKFKRLLSTNPRAVIEGRVDDVE